MMLSRVSAILGLSFAVFGGGLLTGLHLATPRSVGTAMPAPATQPVSAMQPVEPKVQARQAIESKLRRDFLQLLRMMAGWDGEKRLSVDAILLLGRHGEAEVDIPLLVERLRPMESAAPADVVDQYAMRGQFESRRQAIWVALAALGQPEACARIEAALNADHPQMRYWGLLAATYMPEPCWLDELEALVDDERPAVPVLHFDGRGAGGQVDISVGAYAARAIYTLCDPKPKTTFTIEPLDNPDPRYHGGIEGRGLRDAGWKDGYSCIRLSPQQREDARGWLKSLRR
jgi:hypothetical protein